MSIIHDALKKAEKNLTTLTQDELEKAYSQVRGQTKQLKHPQPKAELLDGNVTVWSKMRGVILLGLMMLLFLLVYMVLSMTQTNKPPVVAKQVITPVLDGIMMMNNRAYAVIDGRMYGVGSLIQGGKIVDIQPDHILISRQGEIKTFNVRSHV